MIYFSFISVLDGLPDCYQALSRKRYQVLEDVGASTEVRNLWTDQITTKEILGIMLTQPSINVYIFGSFYEGTTTIGMCSDVDQVAIFNNLPVVIDPGDHPIGTCLLLVQDETTPPGYCKLQVVHNGNPMWANSPGITRSLFLE